MKASLELFAETNSGVPGMADHHYSRAESIYADTFAVLTRTLTISMLPNRKHRPDDTEQQHSRIDELCDLEIFVPMGKSHGHHFLFSDLKRVLTMAQTAMDQTARNGVYAKPSQSTPTMALTC